MLMPHAYHGELRQAQSILAHRCTVAVQADDVDEARRLSRLHAFVGSLCRASGAEDIVRILDEHEAGTVQPAKRRGKS